jgi:hypothetical protein
MQSSLHILAVQIIGGVSLRAWIKAHWHLEKINLFCVSHEKSITPFGQNTTVHIHGGAMTEQKENAYTGVNPSGLYRGG